MFEDLLSQLLVLGILFGLGITIYLKVRKITFTEMVRELKAINETWKK